MEFLPKLKEMNFNAPNLAATWKKWKQTMTFYLTAMMKDKSEEESVEFSQSSVKTVELYF